MVNIQQNTSVLSTEVVEKSTVSVISEQEVFGKSFKIYGTFENPLILAKDVADWIEHSNVTAMIKPVDDDEKIVIEPTKQSLEGDFQANISYTFLTENGVYEVLMLSRKPIAKQFKKEVKKILHELRTKGSVSILEAPHS